MITHVFVFGVVVPTVVTVTVFVGFLVCWFKCNIRQKLTNGLLKRKQMHAKQQIVHPQDASEGVVSEWSSAKQTGPTGNVDPSLGPTLDCSDQQRLIEDRTPSKNRELQTFHFDLQSSHHAESGEYSADEDFNPDASNDYVQLKAPSKSTLETPELVNRKEFESLRAQRPHAEANDYCRLPMVT
ncbi:hypothetical protein CAPTEDRAFT_226510 [Capitella teleta]|uniref:Uncharacterized protein n=1 Tax=Capitella teleta TaxID=283909 RepID=R7T9Y6_CAPTE|nr:hypothetical protein CAPTEDRAFT_226510 [Capitella teleta]|eukprot:ELT90568.1 hypothetical protein CAPTEDRAFT_226510 [Capitella teleta]